ncbi:MAG: hypothetical protein V1777_05645 [Candidatus Micrarchaeota archaeon]
MSDQPTPIWGIRIGVPYNKITEPFKTATQSAEFNLYIDTFKPGYNTPGRDLFVINHWIQQACMQYMPPEPYIGHIKLIFSPKKREIISNDFQPTVKGIMRKMLVASMAELAIKKMLTRYFPDWKCRSIGRASPEREAHLEKTDRKVGEALPIEEEVRRLSEYVRKRMREDYAQRHPPRAKSEVRPRKSVTRMRQFRKK